MDDIGPQRRELTLHGYRRSYLDVGPEPDPLTGLPPAGAATILLVHGIGDTADTWSEVIPALARTHRVIAPDLLGHGRSDKPRADYSVGAYANGLRDLLAALDIPAATVVGHSLGGGIAMQFAYQYPERCDGLVLVSTGGVGREVHPSLRLMSLTRTDAVLRLLHLPGSRLAGNVWATGARLVRSRLAHDARDFLRIFETMPDGPSRQAVLATLRSTVDWQGQRFTMLDRCHLAAGLPTLVLWGRHDPILPVEHAYVAHEAMPGSRLRIFEDAGHFPYHSDPEAFVAEILDLLEETDDGPLSGAETTRTALSAG